MKKSVLIITNSDFAIFNYRQQLIKELKDSFEIYALVTKAFPKEKKIPGVNYVIRMKSKGKYLDYFNIAFGILKFRFKTKIHCTLTFSIIPGIIYGFLKKILVYQEIHIHTITGLGRAFDKCKKPKFGLKYLITSSFRRTNHFFFQSIEDVNAYKQIFLIEEHKISIVNGSGVDLKSFRPEPMKPESSLDRSIIYVGRISEAKGASLMIKLATLIHEQGLNLKLSIFGDFHCKKSTRNQIINLHKLGLLNYMGFTDDPKIAYSRADFLLYCSDYNEGIPKAILEAMACGVIPIINHRIFKTSKHLLKSSVIINPLYLKREIFEICQISNNGLQKMKMKVREEAVKHFNIDDVNRIYINKMQIYME